jgi:hypothetical protein
MTRHHEFASRRSRIEFAGRYKASPPRRLAIVVRLRSGGKADSPDEDDLVVAVCGLVREELGGQAAVHWSVPDPAPAGDPASWPPVQLPGGRWPWL